jgi:predicted Zn-ribbon and HTH transcriptional regulator
MTGKDNQAQTVRQRMLALLGEKEMTARELSQTLGIREREVFDHLTHVARSVAAQGGRLTVLPVRCLSCGYVFEERKRFTRPSRCPRCKKSHIETPVYHLSPAGGKTQ